jgi:glycosyltransferase involved in cell wall biosynthesis
MHIWLVTPYFPPEIGAASVRLGRLARYLASAGHRVTVLTGMPNYPTGVVEAPYRGRLAMRETWEGVDVCRVWVYATPNKGTLARLLSQFSLTLTAALRGMFLSRPDVILLESHPLPIVLAGGWLKAVKRAPIVLNVSDLWPESAVEAGVLRADSLIVRIASRVERWAYRGAAHIVAMTEGVREGIVVVSGDTSRVSLVTNGVDLERFRPGRADLRAEMRARFGLDRRFVVVHVGNLSLFHDFKTILDAAERLPHITFWFVGDGAQGAYVRERAAGMANVIFTGTVPFDDMPGVWAAADASVISMSDTRIAGGARPTKLYESLTAGVPVVAAIRGEGAALIEASGGGRVVPLGDDEAMASALRSLSDDADAWAEQGFAGRAYAERHFAPEAVAAAYAQILEKAAQT